MPDFAVPDKTDRSRELECKVRMDGELLENVQESKCLGFALCEQGMMGEINESSSREEGAWILGENFEREKCDHECKRRTGYIAHKKRR